ncbi:MAG: response regulator, partial [Chloroflexi bacterium]|nr:response regulator [Chloroflexota bacterium]
MTCPSGTSDTASGGAWGDASVQPSNPAAQGRILVVEDDVSLLETLTYRLGREGYAVASA